MNQAAAPPPLPPSTILLSAGRLELGWHLHLFLVNFMFRCVLRQLILLPNICVGGPANLEPGTSSYPNVHTSKGLSASDRLCVLGGGGFEMCACVCVCVCDWMSCWFWCVSSTRSTGVSNHLAKLEKITCVYRWSASAVFRWGDGSMNPVTGGESKSLTYLTFLKPGALSLLTTPLFWCSCTRMLCTRKSNFFYLHAPRTNFHLISRRPYTSTKPWHPPLWDFLLHIDALMTHTDSEGEYSPAVAAGDHTLHLSESAALFSRIIC